MNKVIVIDDVRIRVTNCVECPVSFETFDCKFQCMHPKAKERNVSLTGISENCPLRWENEVINPGYPTD